MTFSIYHKHNDNRISKKTHSNDNQIIISLSQPCFEPKLRAQSRHTDHKLG